MKNYVLKEIKKASDIIEIVYDFLGECENNPNKKQILVAKGIITETKVVLNNLEKELKIFGDSENE